MTESNCRPLITKQVFYHLTNRAKTWCIVRDSNSRQPACKAGTLPTELTMHLVEMDGFEPPRFLQNRFTVCRLQPLGHISKILGSPRWVRTTDLRINSPSLYRLSYQGISYNNNLTIKVKQNWSV